jgi:hypothetical protein
MVVVLPVAARRGRFRLVFSLLSGGNCLLFVHKGRRGKANKGALKGGGGQLDSGCQVPTPANFAYLGTSGAPC